MATRIIDSHIHLWPESMSNGDGHSWMTNSMPLAKEHLLSHYYQASTQDSPSSDQDDTIVEGVVYVETDVRYDTPSSDLATWAKGPLNEIRFLRSIVQGEYGERDSRILSAIVLWAPMDQATQTLEQWLRLAEEVAGPATWKRVKGFRFLLQGIRDRKKFENLVFSKDFIENLKVLGRRGVSFDVGVDQNSGGVWQLEAVRQAMTRVHQDVPESEQVKFTLNHLCKPNFSEDFEQWCEAIESMSKCSRTYMKLSGAFSELPPGLDSIAEHLKPWFAQILKCFGPRRIMFGSDWPVCNLKGLRGEDSWRAWRDVVKELLRVEEYGVSEEDRDRIWRGTAKEAYGI